MKSLQGLRNFREMVKTRFKLIVAWKTTNLSRSFCTLPAFFRTLLYTFFFYLVKKREEFHIGNGDFVSITILLSLASLRFRLNSRSIHWVVAAVAQRWINEHPAQHLTLKGIFCCCYFLANWSETYFQADKVIWGERFVDELPSWSLFFL